MSQPSFGRGMNINIVVGSASAPHLNQVDSQSQDAGLSNDGYRKINSLTLYLPANIDIDRILHENPPTFRYKRDHFVYILHIVTSIPARKRDIIDRNGGYTPINKQYLQKRIHNYKNYLEYLEEVEVIKENRQYIPGERSMGIKFVNSSRMLIPVNITDWPLIKNIVYLNRDYDEELTEELDYLSHWFDDKIQIDFTGALEYLNELYEEDLDNPDIQYEELRYNARLLPLMKLRNKSYAFYVDKTGQRLHTNFTQLMGKLRKFIRYEDKTLVAVDIKNSQLYLALALLDDETFIQNNIQDRIHNPTLSNQTNYPIMLVEKIRSIKNEPDVILFKQWVARGEFYENFGELLLENNLIEEMEGNSLREKAKKIAFSSIYSPNTSISYNRAMQIFKEHFPNVYEIFSWVKRGRGNHPALSICLQRFEAELVLHNGCKRISEENPEIPIYTLHDSIITTEDNVELVESILFNVLEESIGVAPNLKIERWE